MKNQTFLIFCLLFIISNSSFATREMFIPPIQFISEAGGTMAIAGGGQQYCLSAGMNQTNTAPLYGPPMDGLNGVCGAWQKVNISLKNMQNIAQQVTLVVLPGSTVRSINSNGNMMGAAFNEGPRVSISNSQNVATVSIPANGVGTLGFFIMCSSRRCMLTVGKGTTGFFEGPISAPFAGTPIASNPCGDPVQVCINQILNLMLKLIVNENNGALLGSVNVEGGNNGGRTTFYHSSPGAILINGGRAF